MSVWRCEKCGSGEISMSYHAQGCTRPKCSCAECSYNSYNRKHEEHLHYRRSRNGHTVIVTLYREP